MGLGVDVVNTDPPGTYVVAPVVVASWLLADLLFELLDIGVIVEPVNGGNVVVVLPSDFELLLFPLSAISDIVHIDRL